MVQSRSPSGANVPSHERTFAPLDEYDWTCASFGSCESTTQTAHRSVQPFCAADSRVGPNNCPFAGPHLIHASLGPPESITKLHLYRFSPFLHSSRQSAPILQTKVIKKQLTDFCVHWSNNEQNKDNRDYKHELQHRYRRPTTSQTHMSTSASVFLLYFYSAPHFLPSVRLSVHQSVTRRYCVKTTAHTQHGAVCTDR